MHLRDEINLKRASPGCRIVAKVASKVVGSAEKIFPALRERGENLG